MRPKPKEEEASRDQTAHRRVVREGGGGALTDLGEGRGYGGGGGGGSDLSQKTVFPLTRTHSEPRLEERVKKKKKSERGDDSSDDSGG